MLEELCMGGDAKKQILEILVIKTKNLVFITTLKLEFDEVRMKK